MDIKGFFNKVFPWKENMDLKLENRLLRQVLEKEHKVREDELILKLTVERMREIKDKFEFLGDVNVLTMTGTVADEAYNKVEHQMFSTLRSKDIKHNEMKFVTFCTENKK